MTGPVKYVKEVVKEGKRVRWPKRDDLWKTVVVVVIIALFAALFLALWDYVGAQLINQLKNAFGK